MRFEGRTYALWSAWDRNETETEVNRIIDEFGLDITYEL